MIVVTTPTGQIGRQVVDRLLNSNQDVRVIVRDPSKLADQVKNVVEVVQGSHDDPAVLAEAFAGANAVLWLVPPNPGADSVVRYYEDFTRPARDAILKQHVQRVVGISTLGRGWPSNAGNLTAALRDVS